MTSIRIAKYFSRLEPYIWMVVGGACVWGFYAATDARKEQSDAETSSYSARAASVRRTVAEGPVVFATHTDEGEVVEINVPNELAPGVLSSVRCRVWRDGKTNATVSLGCDDDAADIGPAEDTR